MDTHQVFEDDNVQASGGNFTKKLDRGPVQIGNGGMMHVDRRKIRHDVNAAALKGGSLTWHVSRDDRMEATQAGDTLEDIHKLFGVDRESEAVIDAFDKSLWFCHTVNSGSTLQPGRSVLYVRKDGRVYNFPFQRVVDMLGVDIRRFFRAFADECRLVNREVIAGYTLDDVEAKEKYDWLMEVAHQRNLSRHPELSHDTADKCSDLRPDERAALAASSVSVFSSIVNSADRMKANSRVVSIDEAVPQGTAVA